MDGPTITYRVYGIREAGADCFRYVGVTRHTLGRRLSNHIGYNFKAAVTDWLRELLDAGCSPQIVTLAEITVPKTKNSHRYPMCVEKQMIRDIARRQDSMGQPPLLNWVGNRIAQKMRKSL